MKLRTYKNCIITVENLILDISDGTPKFIGSSCTKSEITLQFSHILSSKIPSIVMFCEKKLGLYNLFSFKSIKGSSPSVANARAI